MMNVEINKLGINFMICPQIELLSIIQVISGDIDGKFKPYYYTKNNNYIEVIKNNFIKFSNHDAIKKYKEYNIYNHQIMQYQFDGESMSLTNNEGDSTYLLLINDFIQKSNFCNFYKSMKNYYLNVINYNINNLNNLNLCENLSDFFHSPIRINLILKMIQSDWGEYLYNKDGNYYILGGVSKIEEYPIILNKKGIISLSIHECTHPFVNTNITNDYELLSKTENIFLSISEKSLAKKEYFTYNSYLEDLIVRAITAVIKYKYNYETLDEYKYELKEMSKIGFTLIEKIADIFMTNDFYDSITLLKKYLYNESIISFTERINI